MSELVDCVSDAEVNLPAQTVAALKFLFANCSEPYGSTQEKKRLILEGYVLVLQGKPADLVRRVANGFVSGAYERTDARRGKLPSAEEFNHRLRLLIAERKANGKVVSEDTTTLAPAYGPLWAAKLYSLLLAGCDERMPKPSRFYSMMMAEGGEKGERYRLEHQANNGFRLASLMIRDAEDAKGSLVQGSLARFVSHMEPVPVDGQVFEDWKELHRARGWPWLGSTGKMPVVYLPKGGVEGLAAMADVLNVDGVAHG